MPLRLRSAGGGGVTLKPPVAMSTEAAIEVPAYDGAKMLTDKSPGAVLQVLQAFKSDIWSSSTTTWVDIPGLAVTITPKFASSKFLIQTFLGRVSVNGTSWYSIPFRFTRNGVGIGVGDAAGSRAQAGLSVSHNDGPYDGNGAMMFLDSPNTLSPITYSLQTMGHGSGIVQLNYSESNVDQAIGVYSRNSSNMIVMEVAG